MAEGMKMDGRQKDINAMFQPNGLFCREMNGLTIRGERHPISISGLNLPWEEVLDRGQKIFFKQGDTISSVRDSFRYFYYLQKGCIQTWYEDDQGDAYPHLYMRNGILFNEMVCLSGISNNDFIIFIEDSEVTKFDKDSLFTTEFCQEHYNLLLNAACSIARKGIILSEFKNSNTKMEIINQVSRILYTLISDTDEYSHIQITQNSMAKILRVHRSSITRVIKELKDMGIIAKATGKEIVINDIDALKKLAVGL